MGYNKSKRPILAPKGVKLAGSAGRLTVPTEALTGTTVAQTVAPNGVSFLTYGTSGKTNDFLLPTPVAAGVIKEIFVLKATSSEELNINAVASTANVIWGTTHNTITIAATTVSPAGSAYLRLVSVSTAQWAITVGSTIDWDFSASTGSTDTA